MAETRSPDAASDPEGTTEMPATVAKPTPEGLTVATNLGVGFWIWTTNFTTKQVCRVWRSFTVPETNRVEQALIHITADNVYRLYLDGREIGEGGNWKAISEYDVSSILDGGKHVLAIEGLNDSREAGILFGLRIRFADGQGMTMLSDNSWWVAPLDDRRWMKRRNPGDDWIHAKEVGAVGQMPWWLHPIGNPIPTPPLRPIELNFWQTGWFLVSILVICGIALGLSIRFGTRLAVRNRAHRLMEQERARIARDIHDDLGAALTQLVLQGEVAQTEFPASSPAQTQFHRMCESARAVSQALDEVVWTVNSKRDTLRDFASYICKYAQTFLASTPIRCRLDVEADLPPSIFEMPVRRGLFLAIKEALNNAAKYSRAKELFLRIFRRGGNIVVVVEDNGVGFDPDAPDNDGNGLQNMMQRLQDIGGVCRITSNPGAGCRVEFQVAPVHPGSRSTFSLLRPLGRRDSS